MDVFAIASSGLQAAQAQLNVTANNLANMNTPGYKAQRADLLDISGGGVAVNGTSTSDESENPETSNVDPATEMINLTRAKLLYSANAAVIRVGQKMTGTLLDMFDNQDHDRDGYGR